MLLVDSAIQQFSANNCVCVRARTHPLSHSRARTLMRTLSPYTHQFHHDVYVVRRLVDVVQRNTMRVFDLLHHLDLVANVVHRLKKFMREDSTKVRTCRGGRGKVGPGAGACTQAWLSLTAISCHRALHGKGERATPPPCAQ